MSTSVKAWMDVRSSDPNFGFDQAELVTFNSMVSALPSFDRRSIAQLKDCATGHALARERERAFWELAYRSPSEMTTILHHCLENDGDREVRANLLWLALKAAPGEAMKCIQAALSDHDPEVRDWARLYVSELTGSSFQSEYRTGMYVRNQTFDQTLPLQIAGFAVISVAVVDYRIVLSPLWFAHIQGRVMACTRDDTFMSDLTIEKCYFGYHPDGSNHYEIYPFSGKSWQSGELTFEHRYLGRADRPTYLSGRVEEDPDRQIRVPIVVNRAASTVGRLIEVLERDAFSAPSPIANVKSLLQRRVVSHVRGQYFGWAYASLSHYLQHGDVLPGTVQLVSPTEKETSSMINCYICGTFRGKISDHNGDGHVDVNEILCHGAPDGRLDYLGDGSFAPDPFA